MTSEERHQKRYERRQQKRKLHRQAVIDSIGTVEDVYQFRKMIRYGHECCKNVRWKQSTQSFEQHLLSRCAVLRRGVLNGTYKPKKLYAFTLRERGKVRDAEAPHINDRLVQKVLTKEVLLPLYRDRLIYDNGASLPNKGLRFSQRQFNKSLRKHISKYGLTGWVIISDLKKFFPSADKAILRRNHEELQDTRLRDLADMMTELNNSPVGMPLGVEPSQLEMLALPYRLDNYMSCQLHLRGFGRYMDDYHMIIPPDRNPKEILKEFVQQCNLHNLTVNLSKTQIVPITGKFKFCKARRSCTCKKIYMFGDPASRIRTRRKFKHFLKQTSCNLEYVHESAQSSIAYYRQFDNHSTVLNLNKMFYQILQYNV